MGVAKKFCYVSYTTLLLILILLLAIGIRFHDLSSKGISTYDGANHLVSARTFIHSINWGASNFRNILDSDDKTIYVKNNLEPYLRERGSTTPHAGNPGWIFSISLVGLIFGLQDYTASVISVVFGLGTLILVFLIGKNLFGKKTGLLASAILSMSFSFILFSKVDMAHGLAVFFSTCTLYLYLLNLRTRRLVDKNLIVAGLLLGYSFTVHYIMGFIVAVFILYELILFYRNFFRRSILQRTKRVMIFGVSIAAFPLVFEISFIISKFVLGVTKTTYLEYLFFGKLASNFEKLVDLPFLSYLNQSEMLLRYEGWLFIILLLVGSIFLFRKMFRRFSIYKFILLSHFLIPLLVWSITIHGYPRQKCMIMAFPVMAIIISYGIITLVKNLISVSKKLKKHYNVIFTAIVFIILFAGVFNYVTVYNKINNNDNNGNSFLKLVTPHADWPITNYETFLRKKYHETAVSELVNYMEIHGGTVSDKQLNYHHMMRFYLGQVVDEVPDNIRKSIIFAWKENDVLGDFIIADLNEPQNRLHNKLAADLSEVCNPILVLPRDSIKIFDLRICDKKEYQPIIDLAYSGGYTRDDIYKTD